MDSVCEQFLPWFEMMLIHVEKASTSELLLKISFMSDARSLAQNDAIATH